MSITQFRAYSFTHFLLSVIVTMLYELGINTFVSVVFAKCHRPWYWRERHPDYGTSR